MVYIVSYDAQLRVLYSISNHFSTLDFGCRDYINLINTVSVGGQLSIAIVLLSKVAFDFPSIHKYQTLTIVRLQFLSRLSCSHMHTNYTNSFMLSLWSIQVQGFCMRFSFAFGSLRFFFLMTIKGTRPLNTLHSWVFINLKLRTLNFKAQLVYLIQCSFSHSQCL